MKCGIVTVYDSENAGSFLQAFAMSKALASLEHEAVCLYHGFSDHSASIRKYGILLLKNLIRLGPAAAMRLVERRRLFRQALEMLNIEKNAQTIDCFVLGSDVIWDVSENFFKNHKDFFWGAQFQNAWVISYAPSVGFADEEDVAQCTTVAEALQRMAAVSVRDITSQRLLQPYCDQKIHVVCDPTLLIDREEYEVLEKPTELENFIFLYFYGKMPPEYIRQIKAFAERKNLKTVIFGNGNDWCDMSLAYDPLLFLSLYHKADYVVTNTFHGTVFANIYEKNYVVIHNKTPKIHDFLDMCTMSDKMTRSPEDLERILCGEFDYETTRVILEKEREKGLEYLKLALKEQA